MLDLFGLAVRAPVEVFAIFRNRRSQFVDALVLRGYCAHDLRLPAVAFRSEFEHRFELRFQVVHAFAIGFIQYENVSDLHQAGLHVLDIVTHAGHEQNERAIREADDIHFVLPDTYCFHQHVLLPCRVQNESDIARGACQPTQGTTRRHGADENSSVARMPLHVNAVAQNRAARVRARGIDGDNSHLFSRAAIVRGKTIH